MDDLDFGDVTDPYEDAEPEACSYCGTPLDEAGNCPDEENH